MRHEVNWMALQDIRDDPRLQAIYGQATLSAGVWRYLWEHITSWNRLWKKGKMAIWSLWWRGFIIVKSWAQGAREWEDPVKLSVLIFPLVHTPSHLKWFPHGFWVQWNSFSNVQCVPDAITLVPRHLPVWNAPQKCHSLHQTSAEIYPVAMGYVKCITKHWQHFPKI